MTTPPRIKVGGFELEEAALRGAGWLPATEVARRLEVARAVATMPELPALVRGPVEEIVIAALGRGLDLAAAVEQARSAWSKVAPLPPAAPAPRRQSSRDVIIGKKESQDLATFQAAEKRAAEQGGTLVIAD